MQPLKVFQIWQNYINVYHNLTHITHTYTKYMVKGFILQLEIASKLF